MLKRKTGAKEANPSANYAREKITTPLVNISLRPKGYEGASLSENKNGTILEIEYYGGTNKVGNNTGKCLTNSK